jgi:hypothetical protein
MTHLCVGSPQCFVVVVSRIASLTLERNWHRLGRRIGRWTKKDTSGNLWCCTRSSSGVSYRFRVPLAVAISQSYEGVLESRRGRTNMPPKARERLGAREFIPGLIIVDAFCRNLARDTHIAGTRAVALYHDKPLVGMCQQGARIEPSASAGSTQCTSGCVFCVRWKERLHAPSFFLFRW